MATSDQSRRPLEPIFIATPPPTPLLHLHSSITRTTTPREMPTMYHFDFATSSTTDPEAEEPMRGAGDDPLPPPPLTSGSSLPVPEYVPEQTKQLTPCPCCSRTFVVDALRKHVVICEKSSKKRKIFDSSRQRRDGTALSTYVLPKNFGLPNAERTAGLPSPPTSSREAMTTSVNAAPPEPVNSPQPVRRKSQSEVVRSTARASLRKAASTLSSNSASEAPAGPPAAPAAPPVRERSLARRIKAPACDRCPHCERTFNPKAFDRHVEWCKEKAILNNIKSTNSQETSKAKERLEARKQYKPPNLKTKRSLARDKYSGNHEELLEAGEIAAPKPSMMSLSMTSSVHSDNTQTQVARPRTSAGSGGGGGRGKANSSVTQNQVSLYQEDPPSSPPPRERALVRPSKRSKPESCSEIDDTMERLRTGDALQLAKLDCVEAPVLRPAGRRRSGCKVDKIDVGDKEISLPHLPQVTMTFDELNGLIKRKGGKPICNVEMDDQEIAGLASKHRSSKSLVRQARRRICTTENPNLEFRALQQGSVVSKDVQFASLDSSLVPLQRMQRKVYSGSEEDSPRAEIQIKLEATTMRTVRRPTKRSGQVAQMNSNSEPMRALPMPGLRQSLEAINQSMGQTVLPKLELGNEREEYETEETDEPDNYTSDLEDEYEEKEDPIMRVAKLLELAKSMSKKNAELKQEIQIEEEEHEQEQEQEQEEDEDEDEEEEEEEKEEEEERPLKLPPLTKQNSNVSRRLVLLEQDENGTMYIKSAPNSKRRSNRSQQDPKMPEERLQRQQSNASRASSQEEKQSRLELEKRAAAEEHQQKREIFISIETETNAQGRSPISPESLRHMVGNAQTPIDVLHIENGIEPEHARFSKISDTEDACDEPGDRASQATNRLAPSSSGSALAPNVQLNNAKNLIQQMQSDFRQMGEEASVSMRRMLIVGNNGGRAGEEFRDANPGGPGQGQGQQPHHQVKANSPLTPSPSADSDELSSLDGYPMSSSHGSRRGASSKLSSDSAYGSSNSPYSLSRQRSTELQTGSPRGQGLLRPHTASAKLPGCMMDASTQAQTDYGTLKARQRLFAPDFGNNNGAGSESCSSGSDHSFAAQPNPQQQQQQETSNYNYQQQQQQQETGNYNYQQQQQQQQEQEQAQSPPAYNNNNNNDNNNSVPMTPTTSEHSLKSNSSTSESKKMSNFCYECGSKFIIKSAKFCMDCGVKRVKLNPRNRNTEHYNPEDTRPQDEDDCLDRS
ncbi:apoptotic chromatin condensation inducer in the nucleus isoform X6 [Drosophila subpulchrella]|uniref:apoptotic chromatin condensation inducer in the nucleus isoform X6 n=1 Tax=Drosophila subpulchrella TaxID=1486046 RepID=UPI0018A15853|nr:apoptotic chromatin condensation inducer in the nucleus isoform X6 [Drosophila subpulchrella]